ncbi:MAG: Crp/Fnr family transcriptional regulator [Acidimicrobiales bacterium]|nr:Crp/Fnr family transcriptional regulator [Acidimicrobiales bacterium]
MSRAALFSGLRASRILELAQHSFVQCLDQGDLLFSEGDRGNSLYVVAKGHLRLYTTDGDGTQHTLALLGPPATFGELAVFDRRRRSATAEATEPAEVVGVPAKALRDAYRADPDLAEALLRSLAALVRSATSQRSTVLFWDLHRRVASALLDAADANDGRTVYLDANAATLAEQAGGSGSAVNKIVHQLEREGAIRQQGLLVEILDRDGLLRLIDPD